MGGYGSGRWHDHNRKTVVDDCLSLSVADLTGKGLTFDCYSQGSIWWSDPDIGTKTGSLEYTLDPGDGEKPVLRLSYSLNDNRQNVDLPLSLTKTMPYFGGVRWWFICPLFINGNPCHRRVGKLYLPDGQRFFGCRHCHNLTYWSAQTHDKHLNLILGSPGALAKLTNSATDPRAWWKRMLAFKAMGVMK